MTGTSSIRKEFARYREVTCLPGVEVLDARFSSHRFSPHSHEHWSIGAVLSGAKDNAAGPARNIVQAGELTVLCPNQAHAGKVAGEDPCHYVMVYVAPEAMSLPGRKRA